MATLRAFLGGGERDFRWRGKEVSRIEGLSDAVFALALTLIVVSLEVPKTSRELIELFVGVPVFAVCFTILAMCWFFHNRFHRRFGLATPVATLLDLLFLFVVLLYVYPLRFLFDFLYGLLLGRGNARLGADGVLHEIVASQRDMQTLMVLYGAGFAALFLLLAAMNALAWSHRLELELDSVERVRTKSEIHGHFLSAGVGLISALIVSFAPERAATAGFLYSVLGPLHWLHGRLTARAVERYRGKVPGAPMAS